MNKIILKRNEERRLSGGHLWIFSNEIREIQGAPAAGEIVELYNDAGTFIGIGFYNPRSLIAFRLLTRQREAVDEAFWVKRIGDAASYRAQVYPGLASFRAVFGESDFLPGLIVDKYERYLAVQFLSAGLEKEKLAIIAALNRVFSPEGIVARNDSGLRLLEGLEEKTEIIDGTVPERVEIEENGCRFWANLLAGQKTGFFFDQRDNRAAFARYCTGKKVLDGFCHTGAFGVYAMKAGAAEVVWADASKPALSLAEQNAALNGLAGRFNGIAADLFEYLDGPSARREKFDIINIDPPALIKSRKHFQAGFRAYRKLNTSALSLLDHGGLLATSSCSHNLSPDDFRTMLHDAAAKSGKQVRLLEIRSQSRDHPVLLSMPETEYLKFALLQVV